MTKKIMNNSIHEGIIISTTGFPKNSHPSDYRIDWSLGSEKIVGLEETIIDKTSTQKTFSQKTVFPPQYVFIFSDEQSMLDPHKPPMKLWWAAQEYQDWIVNQCKGPIPAFKEVVDTLCSRRLSLMLGLGGYIFCELASDAKVLISYYQD